MTLPTKHKSLYGSFLSINGETQTLSTQKHAAFISVTEQYTADLREKVRCAVDNTHRNNQQTILGQKMNNSMRTSSSTYIKAARFRFHEVSQTNHVVQNTTARFFFNCSYLSSMNLRKWSSYRTGRVSQKIELARMDVIGHVQTGLDHVGQDVGSIC